MCRPHPHLDEQTPKQSHICTHRISSLYSNIHKRPHNLHPRHYLFSFLSIFPFYSLPFLFRFQSFLFPFIIFFYLLALCSCPLFRQRIFFPPSPFSRLFAMTLLLCRGARLCFCLRRPFLLLQPGSYSFFYATFS